MVRVIALVVLLSVCTVPAANAQIFLEVVGQAQGPIQGDATLAGQENRIEISSASQGFYVLVDPGSGTVGNRFRGSMVLSKPWDSSSTKLLRAQGEEEQLTTCVLRFLRNVPAAAPELGSFDRRMPMIEVYLTVELLGARIESHSTSGSGGIAPTSSLSLTYDAVRYTYADTQESFFDAIRGPGSLKAMASQGPKTPGRLREGFEFDLPEDGLAGIEITDEDGRWVTTLFDDDAAQSGGVVRWDATDANGEKVPAGVYTATVRTSEAEITRRMVIGG